MVSIWLFVLLLAILYDHVIMYVGLFGHFAVVFHVFVSFHVFMFYWLFVWLCFISDILLIYDIRLTALCPGLPRWAGTRKVKPIWILLEQETLSGSGISWAVCKSAPRSRQIGLTTPAPHRSIFTGRMPFLPPNQQRQSTEGTNYGH